MVTRSKKKQKHLFYDREWMIFPFAIGWNKELYYTQEPMARITFHFCGGIGSGILRRSKGGKTDEWGRKQAVAL